MRKVEQKENETRKDYLIRVAIEMLEDNWCGMSNIEYDEAECDALCLAEDLRVELDSNHSCTGNCGMNYCDNNGCIERKRVLVEPTDLPIIKKPGN